VNEQVTERISNSCLVGGVAALVDHRFLSFRLVAAGFFFLVGLAVKERKEKLMNHVFQLRLCILTCRHLPSSAIRPSQHRTTTSRCVQPRHPAQRWSFPDDRPRLWGEFPRRTFGMRSSPFCFCENSDLSNFRYFKVGYLTLGLRFVWN